MPKGKGFNVKESGRRYREVMNDCAAYARQFPKSQRIRAYKDCLKAKLRTIEQVG
jgi:hypothetical protein